MGENKSSAASPYNGVLNIGGLSLGIEYISIDMFTGLSDEVYTNP